MAFALLPTICQPKKKVNSQNKRRQCRQPSLRLLGFTASCHATDSTASVNRPKINAIEIVPASANAAREEEDKLELAAASLLQVAPNPFSENTTLRFQLEQTQAATLQLYDLQGHPLRTLFSGEVAAGVVQQVELESAGLPAGVYLVRLVTAHQVSHVKLSLQH